MMKKLLTVAVIWLLSMPTVLANSFEFRYHGESLADGATVTIAAEINDFEELACETNPMSDPNNGLVLKLLSGNNATGNATVTIEENTLNPMRLEWCMGGLCSMITGNTFTKTFSTENDIVRTQFDALGIQSEGVLLATLTATIGSETHTVKIKFTNGDVVEDTGIWWGYFGENDVNADNYGGYGVSTKANYEVAIKILKNDPIMGGATVKAMRLWLKESTIPKLDSLKIWINKNRKNDVASSPDVLFVQKVDLSTLKAGANEIVMTTPFAINNTVTYIGYSLYMNSQDEPIMCGGDYVPESFHFRATAEKTNWGLISDHGKLALQVLADGVNLSENSAVPSDFGNHAFQKGEEAIIPVKITNKGKNPLTSISYTITTNNDPSTTTPETTVSMNNTSLNSYEMVNVLFDTSEALKCTRTLTITKVNGVPNEATEDEASANGDFKIVSEFFTKVPVVEEFTGTWCQYCPAGIVGMQYAHETFGDKVVLIAAHTNDPMTISDYDAISNQVSGVPSSFVNRELDVYPHPVYLFESLSQSLEELPDGKVDLTALWNDEAKTKIDVEASSKFAFAEENANYGIALVLIEDGLTGKTTTWGQVNGYSGGNGDPYLEWWYAQGARVYGLEYDHVAVGAWNILNGFDGSVNTSFEAGEEMKFNYQADISNKTVIQDKSKLKLAALLIDRKTGHIVNAAQTDIKTPVEPLVGDVNHDGSVNAADVTALYGFILNGNTEFIETSDVNGDNSINAADVTAVYRIILGQTAEEEE